MRVLESDLKASMQKPLTRGDTSKGSTTKGSTTKGKRKTQEPDDLAQKRGASRASKVAKLDNPKPCGYEALQMLEPEHTQAQRNPGLAYGVVPFKLMQASYDTLPAQTQTHAEEAAKVAKTVEAALLLKGIKPSAKSKPIEAPALMQQPKSHHIGPAVENTPGLPLATGTNGSLDVHTSSMASGRTINDTSDTQLVCEAQGKVEVLPPDVAPAQVEAHGIQQQFDATRQMLQAFPAHLPNVLKFVLILCLSFAMWQGQDDMIQKSVLTEFGTAFATATGMNPDDSTDTVNKYASFCKLAKLVQAKKNAPTKAAEAAEPAKKCLTKEQKDKAMTTLNTERASFQRFIKTEHEELKKNKKALQRKEKAVALALAKLAKKAASKNKRKPNKQHAVAMPVQTQNTCRQKILKVQRSVQKIKNNVEKLKAKNNAQEEKKEKSNKAEKNVQKAKAGKNVQEEKKENSNKAEKTQKVHEGMKYGRL